MGHGKTGEMPPGRNGLEALYSTAVQKLEQLQLQNFRKTMKKYLQSTEVRDWMRSKRRKSVQMIHPAPCKDPRVDDTKIHVQERHSSPSHAVNMECHAFPKCRTQRVENNIGKQNERQRERVRDIGPAAVKPSRIATQPTKSSNRKVDCLFHEPETSRTSIPQSSSELGRFRKRIETTKTCRRSSSATTAVGCETLTSTRRSSTKGKPQSAQVGLAPTKTECSSTFFHIRNMKYDHEGTTNPTTRPASMTLRRELNCKALIEEVKRQRALGAKLELRKREHLNAPMEIVILRRSKQASATNESRTEAFRNEDKHFTSGSEIPKSIYFKEKRCNGTTRPSYEIGSKRPTSRSMLISTLTQSPHLATARDTTAILQDALEALECAHRWNEWGERTLHQLARASQAAVERRLDVNEPKTPQMLLPHDNDIVTSSRQGKVLESREEERVFIRDLLVASGITSGDWVDKHLLEEEHQHIIQRPKQQGPFKRRFTDEKKLVDQRTLCDFVEELLRHELVLRTCAQPGTHLTTWVHGQAFVQKVWNRLQTLPAPASGGTCTSVQLVLQREIKAQEPTLVEVAQVARELEEMIYENLVQELLEELKRTTVLR